jgi:hypothetical protein
MLTFGVLLIALATLATVFYWSGRFGGRGGTGGTSLRRSPHSHVTSRGRPKIAYASREDAETRARQLAKGDGAQMNVYRCDTCAKWHVGHLK